MFSIAYDNLKRLFRKPDDPIVMPGSIVSHDSEIGKYTYIGYNCSITKSRIGRYVSIANNVSIGPGEHDYAKISTSSAFYDDPYARLTARECVIGNDVWIGVDAIVRRGVKIGDGAVIGANSFVNTDIPEFAIAAGNPAKVLKYRFDATKIRCIKNSHWWDLGLDRAREAIALLELEGP